MGIPVILDTDIGFDVDDVWALAFLLNCPEIDVKLITTTTGDTVYRAKLVAKLLQIAGREDIPIGLGLSLDSSPKTHAQWLGDFSFSDYAGDVLKDGVGAICDVAERSSQQVTLVAIGPLPNVAAALARDPNLTSNARFVGMHGSLRRGYLGREKPMREYNVKQHALACQAVFKADWHKTITPLDTCGAVALDGPRMQTVLTSQLPLAKATLENHFGWFESVKEWPVLKDIDPQTQSSILYDSVAVYLAFSEEFLHMEELPIAVTDDGKTLIDDAGALVSCATDWLNKEAFLDLLCVRLTENVSE